MIEKIRISLWDFLTYFLSGFLFVIVFCGYLYFTIDTNKLFEKFKLSDIPTSFVIFVFPILCTLIGMLLEPISNFFDRILFNPLFKRFFLKRQKEIKDEVCNLEDIIKDKLSHKYNIPVKNIYHFCKDYIEQKQINNFFMIFLSKFGFYRNIAFICFISAIVSFFIFKVVYVKFIIFAVWLFCMCIFKFRSLDFYSYLAPTIYRCFIGCLLQEQINEKPNS